MKKPLVVIPLYNEQETITSVVEHLRKHYSGDILVVDDGSTDCSPCYLNALDQQGLHVIVHEQNSGYGASLIDGFNFGRQHNYDALVTIDCDWQHEPRYVPQFFEALQESDVVSGSRYLKDFDSDVPAPSDRRAINREITQRINEITGYGITDAFCGFKAYRLQSLKGLVLNETGYAFPLQFWIQAHHYGLRVRELPVPRIYVDPKRSFGADLDDPERRRKHYHDILNRELERVNDVRDYHDSGCAS